MDNIFIDSFSDLADPRVDRTKKHLLLDIIALGICGILTGAESWEEIADFGVENEEWFGQFLALPNGIPSHDTLSRVFSALDPAGLQSCCINWLARIKPLVPEGVIAIDGKSLRGSKRLTKCQKALHIVNAWSCENSICLGQIKVDDKSNEIPAVPELLKLLHIKGAIVTLDAMGAQESTIKQIVESEADYVIALKGNQGALHELAADTYKLMDEGSESLTCHHASDEVDAAHGRIEQRRLEVIPVKELENQIESRWEYVRSLVRVTSTRIEASKETTEQRYYISSLSPEKPAEILRAVRQHWAVENKLHWSLDVTFREDQCRVREGNAAENLSWLRKTSLGLLKKESTFKASIRRKQRKACVDLNYLAKVIHAN